MSLMLAVTTGVSVMKNVELTQLIVDEGHVAWLATAGYGYSYDTLIVSEILFMPLFFK